MPLITYSEKTAIVNSLRVVRNSTNETSRGIQRDYYMAREYIRLNNGRVVGLPESFVKTEFWFGEGMDCFSKMSVSEKHDFFVDRNMSDSFRDWGYFKWKRDRDMFLSGENVPCGFLATPLVTFPKDTDDPTRANIMFSLATDQDMEFWREHYDVYVLSEQELADLDSVMTLRREEYKNELERVWEENSVCITARER